MSAGTKLIEGAVADTCEAAGMRAVCAGDYSCQYSSNRCEVVSFESSVCGDAMKGLAEKVCGEEKLAADCPQLDGLFSYIHEWDGGECGVVDGQRCVPGTNSTSGNHDIYYAYCVTSNTAPIISGKSFLLLRTTKGRSHFKKSERGEGCTKTPYQFQFGNFENKWGYLLFKNV